MSGAGAQRSVIVIGGGMAGLAAGCYARRCGMSATIVEQHFLPGGLCTSWERKGYVLDGCLSYLYGTAPGGPYHPLWKELGALDGRRAIHLDEFIRSAMPTDGKRSPGPMPTGSRITCSPSRRPTPGRSAR